jgi:NMD protein affecting ribosome stability and mRNA decay
MRLRMQPMNKKDLPCLRCGRQMRTDAAHRLCRKCRRHNSEIYDVPVHCTSREVGAASLWA